jgi:hypothetical protein
MRVRAAVVTAGAGTGARTTFTDRSPNGTAVGAGGGIFVGQGRLPIWRLGGYTAGTTFDMMVNGQWSPSLKF